MHDDQACIFSPEAGELSQTYNYCQVLAATEGVILVFGCELPDLPHPRHCDSQGLPTRTAVTFTSWGSC